MYIYIYIMCIYIYIYTHGAKDLQGPPTNSRFCGIACTTPNVSDEVLLG